MGFFILNFKTVKHIPVYIIKCKNDATSAKISILLLNRIIAMGVVTKINAI